MGEQTIMRYLILLLALTGCASEPREPWMLELEAIAMSGALPAAAPCECRKSGWQHVWINGEFVWAHVQ